MRNRTMRFAVLGAMTAGVMLTQQACAGESTAEPVAAGSTAEAPVPASEPAAPPNPDEGAVPLCKTTDLEANITLQPDGKGDTRMGLVTLTNKSDLECTVGGRAAISLKNPADEVVEVPTEEVEQPGEAARTALKVGSSVFQGIKWTVCDKGDSSCGTGNTLVFSLEASTDGEPAELSNFPDPAKNAITMRSLQVGTIQLSRQGVVAW
ncbi:DUF4232 domain-containing protein [Actinoplanes sp. G11-F43]|uniref:DUF4232 domain-containing protein n=1 Tax=Actinoplanes sp. G11-F43 TaxID=3424130 RepID=UPI003D33F6EE